MADVDSLVLQADPTVTTIIAAHLNAAMARNEVARAAYARIYGESWESLGNGIEINDTATANAKTAR